MSLCNLCSRHCNVDRDKKNGFCGVSNNLKLAKADIFMWEEPVISGTRGSGAIFFSGCNLKCIFCQNYKISSGCFGQDISAKRLAEIFKELEDRGAHNINLVTPTHYTDKIIEALNIYKPKVPIVYNTNSYESDESLEKLKPYIDIYLPDLKFFSEELSQKYSNAKDYFAVASKNILKMVSAQPKVIIDENGIMQKGVIIRHLVMPNCVPDSIKVLEWIAANVKDNVLISIMGQYTPYYKACDDAKINRKITPLEYKCVINKMTELNLTNGFMQELNSANEIFIPEFNLNGVTKQ